MPYLRIHHNNITPEIAEALCGLCPFSAISYRGGRLAIDAGCRMCGICTDEGPVGAVTLEDGEEHAVDKSEWSGIAVFAEYRKGAVHPVTMELIGKARELADMTDQPVYVLLIGSGVSVPSDTPSEVGVAEARLTDSGKISETVAAPPASVSVSVPTMASAAESLAASGADAVYVYDDPAFDEFLVEPYANAFSDFIEKVKPSAVLVGATSVGRSLAPRVAARFRTGLTATARCWR
jgi:electron transfer flavoprotein alpha subunit